MSKHPATLAAIAGVLAMTAPFVSGATPEQPNIIVIYADDMGYGDCTVNNPESKIPTPHIDRLAKEGLRFTDAHSPSSTCTASRYGLLTGINPARTGVTNRITGLGPVIGKDEVTVADFLKDQGYVTRMIGKWHLGFDLHAVGPRGKTFDFSKPLTGGPLDCGFDSYFGLCKSIGPPYFYIRGRQPVAKPTETTPGTTKDLKTNGKDVRTAYPPGDIAPGFVPEECNAAFCDEAVKILREHAASGGNKPLFLYYAMLEPHTPWLPTDEFIGKSKAGSYGNYIVQLDHEVGRVLAALKESGLEKGTVVIFSSDNGAMWRSQDIERFSHRANGIFSGTKGTAWEGGHRVPFIIRWPGEISASTVSGAVINHTDLFATLAELFHVDLAQAYPGSAADSYSFLSVLSAPESEHRRPGMAVTPGSYRLGDSKLRFARGGAGSVERTAADAVLHNLAEDPAEEKDLSESHSETKSRLFAEYQQFIAKRKLKPLAVQVSERRSQKKGRSRQPKKKTPAPKAATTKNANRRVPAARGLQLPEDVQLSDEQKTKYEALVKEYRRRMAELREKLADVLTDEQTQARAAAKKKALEDGKRGMALRTAVDAAVKLTLEQQKQLQGLRQAMGQLTREYRDKLHGMLTDEDSRRTPTGNRANPRPTYPEFSWDRIPLYMHIRKATSYTDEEIAFLAKFPLITFEKANGHQDHGSVEKRTLIAARAVKKVNPKAKILNYRNVIVHFGSYAKKDGLRYSRTFANASVILDVKRRTAEIQWRTPTSNSEQAHYNNVRKKQRQRCLDP